MASVVVSEFSCHVCPRVPKLSDGRRKQSLEALLLGEEALVYPTWFHERFRSWTLGNFLDKENGEEYRESISLFSYDLALPLVCILHSPKLGWSILDLRKVLSDAKGLLSPLDFSDWRSSSFLPLNCIESSGGRLQCNHDLRVVGKLPWWPNLPRCRVLD